MPLFGVRWVQPESLHLTLKFLGDAPAEQVPELTDALLPVVAARRSEPFSLAGVGLFPNLRRPNVLWVGVREGGEWLAELAAALDAALVPLGFPPEGRAFRAHITLGRVRQGTRWPLGPLEQLLMALVDRSFGSVMPRSAVLFASTLTRDGAIHDPLAELPLGFGVDAM